MKKVDFQLKGFGITQSRTAMKVGTDALLLGAWGSRLLGLSPRRILDVGTGTGILSLMLAQAFPNAQCDALEIDEGAMADARENFASSPYADRLNLYAEDALTFSPRVGYDFIVSNPPFYSQDTLPAYGSSRQLARQERGQGLGIQSLIHLAHDWLLPGGKLALICPCDRESDLRSAACQALMYLDQICTFSSREGEPIRLLVSLGRLQDLDGYHDCHKSHLSQRDQNNKYNTDYKVLLSDFLLDSVWER